MTALRSVSDSLAGDAVRQRGICRELETMKPSTTLQKACQVLRRRVRLDGASIRLDESTFPKDDTDQIRDAMRLYVETWIVPIIDDIETGNTERLARFVDGERGHSIEP